MNASFIGATVAALQAAFASFQASLDELELSPFDGMVEIEAGGLGSGSAIEMDKSLGGNAALLLNGKYTLLSGYFTQNVSSPAALLTDQILKFVDGSPIPGVSFELLALPKVDLTVSYYLSDEPGGPYTKQVTARGTGNLYRNGQGFSVLPEGVFSLATYNYGTAQYTYDTIAEAAVQSVAPDGASEIQVTGFFRGTLGRNRVPDNPYVLQSDYYVGANTAPDFLLTKQVTFSAYGLVGAPADEVDLIFTPAPAIAQYVSVSPASLTLNDENPEQAVTLTFTKPAELGYAPIGGAINVALAYDNDTTGSSTISINVFPDPPAPVEES